MYSIYVTNETGANVYVRLQRRTLSSLNENFHQGLGSQTGAAVNSYLVRWGFCTIPPGKTMSFAAEVANNGSGMYASLYDQSKLWIMDYEVNCARYGCVFVKRHIQPSFPMPTETLYLHQANPEPVWVPRRTGDSFPGGIIKVGSNAVKGDVYYGRSSDGGTKPCTVTTKADRSSTVLVHRWFSVLNGEELLNGELLKDTGHEFIRASRGDPVPPNAVIGGVNASEGTLYLGRVGGNIPCSVSIESGRIKCFCFHAGNGKQVQSGEVLVLLK